MNEKIIKIDEEIKKLTDKINKDKERLESLILKRESVEKDLLYTNYKELHVDFNKFKDILRLINTGKIDLNIINKLAEGGEQDEISTETYKY